MTQDIHNIKAPRRLSALSGRATLRFLLLVIVPLVALVSAGTLYLLGGRYVETENAYVHADKVSVVPEVAGTILEVSVVENQPVHAGDRLFTIDPSRYRIAVAQAESALADVQTQIETLKAQYREQEQQLRIARSNLEFAHREYQRQMELARSHAVSESVLDSYRHQWELAQQQLAQAEKALDRLRAGLAGDPDIAVSDPPMYRKAEAALAAARQDLDDTVVVSPLDGLAAKVPVVGQYVGPSRSAMTLVSSDRVWIEANLKETQLTHVREGQPVTIEVDAYPDLELEGRVGSIAGATGSEFSILPAQNATGNWVKVVQRVPVRIELESLPEAVRLRSGLSVLVEIDTGWHHRGPGFLAPVVSWVRGLVGSATAAERDGAEG